MLGDVRGLWEDPWGIRGNFNMIRYLRERRKCVGMSTMQRFSKIIKGVNMHDLSLNGSPFPWGSNDQSMSMLDRFLVSKEWKNHFSGLLQCVLSRLVYHHLSIFLDGGGIGRGKPPLDSRICGLKRMALKTWLKTGGWAIGLGALVVLLWIPNWKLKGLKSMKS